MNENYECDAELTGTIKVSEDGTTYYLRDRLIDHWTTLEIPNSVYGDLQAALLTHEPRVVVSGRTRYFNGRPNRMQVESLTRLPTLEEHPGLFAVQGIDITGGMDSAEYVRSIRGD